MSKVDRLDYMSLVRKRRSTEAYGELRGRVVAQLRGERGNGGHSGSGG